MSFGAPTHSNRAPCKRTRSPTWCGSPRGSRCSSSPGRSATKRNFHLKIWPHGYGGNAERRHRKPRPTGAITMKQQPRRWEEILSEADPQEMVRQLKGLAVEATEDWKT